MSILAAVNRAPSQYLHRFNAPPQFKIFPFSPAPVKPSRCPRRPRWCPAAALYLPTTPPPAWRMPGCQTCVRGAPCSAPTWPRSIPKCAAHKERTAYDGPLDNSVFSSFVTTYVCGNGEVKTQQSWIEPLAHGLRHPNAFCGRGADLVDRGYLLLELSEGLRSWDELGLMGACSKGRRSRLLFLSMLANPSSTFLSISLSLFFKQIRQQAAFRSKWTSLLLSAGEARAGCRLMARWV